MNAGIKESKGVNPFQNTVDVADALLSSAADVSNALCNMGAVNDDVRTQAFADIISSYLSTTYTSSTEVEDVDGDTTGYTITGVDDGYYLVKDTAGSLEGDNDAYTRYIVKVLGNETNIAPKSAMPTVDKQVHDETADAEAGNVGGWGESADHAINESFQFKLTATLSADDNYAAYETYKIIFTDTMSEGVSFESIASVKVNETDVPLYDINLAPDGYQTTANTTSRDWTLTIADIKKYDADLTDGAVIEVIYNAHLNENAIVSKADVADGNKITNNVNHNTVDLQFSNNPNAGASGDLGRTPEDTVWVFTYEVDNTKYSEKVDTANVLAGAEFTLYDADDAVVGLMLDTRLNAYRPIKTGDTATVMTSAAEGVFNIVGLDAGTYTLKETKTPAGYNTCADIEIVITSEHKEDTTGDGNVDMKLTGSKNMDNDIINVKGSQLPSTGGIGTTIFVVGGGAMVAAAGILLVSKKRMSK